MTRTLQKPHGRRIRCARRAFLALAGEHFGRSLSDVELDALDQLDDLAALATAFPDLTATERTETLWALRLSVRATAPSF